MAKTLRFIASLSGLRTFARTCDSDTLQLPCAVTDALSGDTHPVQHGEVEVGHRRLLVEFDVATRSQGAAATPGHENGQVVVVVTVAVADRAAINNHAVVEQCPFGFLHGF